MKKITWTNFLRYPTEEKKKYMGIILENENGVLVAHCYDKGEEKPYNQHLKKHNKKLKSGLL